jgi:hypothetical protein
MSREHLQLSICAEVDSPVVPPVPESKVGIALGTLNQLPLNALRHPVEGSACGWYIWGGEEMSQNPEFFQPLHVAHLADYCPAIVPYLALAPGWRVLLAPSQREVWYDGALLKV